MSEKKTLILTGWSRIVYLAAAAAAFEALKGKADVAGVSMEALAGALRERAPNYKRVLVLGVGLKKNIGETVSALMSLKTKGVQTVWLSSLPVAPEFAAEVCLEGIDPATRGFDVLVDEPRESLLDVVADYLHIDAEAVSFFRAYTEKAEDRSSAVGMYQTLMKAAGYMHRTRRDDSIYELAIRALGARIKPALWDAKIVEARDDFLRFGHRELGGVSAIIGDVRQRILQAAKYERARVLILGESGTGKETVAEQIHANSRRKNNEFVAFNCASVSPSLLEDRFFGHEKGAFTGADKLTKGLFERADHGTLFLDEIGEMPLEAQGILLRALEEGKIVRVGGTDEITVDVRLVAATNRNLPKMVREKKFRADLYQRLSTIPITVPALRKRKEDISEIADGFWMDALGQHLKPEQLAALEEYDYPGNVRELLNILDRARALEEDDFKKLIREHREINRELYPEALDTDGEDAPDNLEEMTRRHVKRVFKKYGENRRAATQALGISINTLKKYLEEK